MSFVKDSSLVKLHIEIIEARGLRAADSNGKSDPYCRVHLNKHDTANKHKTATIKTNLNPTWNESVTFYPNDLQLESDRLVFQVFDKDLMSKDDLLGTVKLSLANFFRKKKNGVDGWYRLMDRETNAEGSPTGWKLGKGQLHLRITLELPGFKTH